MFLAMIRRIQAVVCAFQVQHKDVLLFLLAVKSFAQHVSNSVKGQPCWASSHLQGELVSQHDVKNGEELMHARDDGNFLRFARNYLR